MYEREKTNQLNEFFPTRCYPVGTQGFMGGARGGNPQEKYCQRKKKRLLQKATSFGFLSRLFCASNNLYSDPNVRNFYLNFNVCPCPSGNPELSLFQIHSLPLQISFWHVLHALQGYTQIEHSVMSLFLLHCRSCALLAQKVP
jgi:hypothetical protein